ncbi:N-acetylglucosaminyl deacetylase [Proteiniphilum saccharofermentans]|uniref:N-acetylglucosaminyl deacetylase n=1 Tax=Proteiniphilum saccharofermentans TaxID=1642647 RepID=A0A1R3T0B6_9BACT|nr:PIG-L deacetylase family protein [Proteiniphilum saccharofermentans]SCD21853.1 N-acetylglucosaminyl deacetylase [Proteiniphilum saccharofermentans]
MKKNNPILSRQNHLVISRDIAETSITTKYHISMKYLFAFIIFVFCYNNSYSQNNQINRNDKINVIVFGAHPDDADSKAGGTAIQFAKMGHNVLFVSLTNGDAGHQSMGGGALAKRRRAEADEAGERFGVSYIVLENHDGELMATLDVRKDVIRLIRQWNADIVIGHRQNDYHPDHRNAAILVQDAAYMVIVPNVVSDTPSLKKNPLFLYAQDNFQKPYPFKPDIAIDISDVIDQKIYAMAAHESQYFEWLPWTNSTIAPTDKEERIEWLKNSQKTSITTPVRESLTKWYGKGKGSTITAAESFEICEYGKQPTEEEIKELFPMLK